MQFGSHFQLFSCLRTSTRFAPKAEATGLPTLRSYCFFVIGTICTLGTLKVRVNPFQARSESHIRAYHSKKNIPFANAYDYISPQFLSSEVSCLRPNIGLVSVYQRVKTTAIFRF